ncbi:helix-turn-helix domain-containing GNAT family N-acetyltransferase [Dyella sp.]|uniref:bifunctional helix-turn-helix transcriptional regulator/GNAT family N-acetyltransferase n=1 Tax=Dyella sp. TaxID=1869338 RepID=UPI002B45A2F2|nr:helix-turn-helix domain-containing GNAT family N-acetyltransferase [Dyella sp.]HKT27546.1 helix-turn-helix domain-containing GNAT family N-acetyltransferase [Dyella sp.]
MSTKPMPPQFAEQIAAIREFNRFYTAHLGLLRRRHLDGEFALTEARILYEISAQPKVTAATLQDTLELDAGYMSRLLSGLIRRKLIRRVTSDTDAREKPLVLTATGQKAVARLNEQSMRHIRDMLAHLNTADRDALVASLAGVRSLLEGRTPPLRIVRLTEVNDDALAILHEYYEAVHVVQRDKPGSIQKLIDTPASGVWLAYLGDEVAGCVVLRKLANLRGASECKRLYVKPGARGKHIADKLLDAQEAFARDEGIEWIYLDSYDDLKAAIALYEKRGYEHCERYNDNPQATVFMRKYVGWDGTPSFSAEP